MSLPSARTFRGSPGIGIWRLDLRLPYLLSRKESAASSRLSSNSIVEILLAIALVLISSVSSQLKYPGRLLTKLKESELKLQSLVKSELKYRTVFDWYDKHSLFLLVHS